MALTTRASARPRVGTGVAPISYTFINRRLGDYVLLCRLAIGGQSEVFLAKKTGPGEFDRPVVIKALPSQHRDNEQYVELFHREAFLSARFSHPHVITVHDARVLENEQCMVMDFISGQTVADIAQRGYKAGAPPSTNQAVRIVADACDGLNYTHGFRGLDETEYPVVHRDVSPQNLMVTYQGNTLVFDFGIAKVVGKDSRVDTLAGGKYAYMSPEQCLGEEVDTRSDIFSLGVILYELTVGTRLFRRDTKDEVVEAVTEGRIEPPGSVRPKFPTMLEDVVMKALQRDPDRRYQRAGRMRDDLRDFLALQGGEEGRVDLGQYVAGLFEPEREKIADIVRRADEAEEDPKPVGQIPLEKLGREDVDLDEVEQEPVAPAPEANPPAEEKPDETPTDDSAEVAGEAGDRQTEEQWGAVSPTGEGNPVLGDESGSREGGKDEGGRDEAGNPGESAEELHRELEQMRERQSMLFIAIGILSLLAIGLSILTIAVGSDDEQNQPVEIQSKESSDNRGS